MKAVLDLIGRIFIAVIFLYDAYDNLMFAKETKRKMIEYGLTWQTDFLFNTASFILVLGGVLVLIGYRSSFGALLLLLYYIPVTMIAHSFWNDPIAIQRIQAELFMKNISICGGLLMILVNGSGPISVKRLFATSRVPGA
jgi:putative oxidoreductase